MSATNEPAASPLHRQELDGEKRLGDYSFVSDVISVAVLFDLPCPVRAHHPSPCSYPLLLDPLALFSTVTPPERPPTPMHRLHILLVSTLSAPPLFSHSHKRHKHK